MENALQHPQVSVDLVRRADKSKLDRQRGFSTSKGAGAVAQPSLWDHLKATIPNAAAGHGSGSTCVVATGQHEPITRSRYCPVPLKPWRQR